MLRIKTRTFSRRLQLFILAGLLIISSVVGTIPTASTSYASNCDSDFYKANDVLFFDPCFSECTATGAVSTGKIGSLRGKNNAEKIYNFWIDTGLTSNQAAGITGSIKHESGFSPFRQEGGQAWPAGGWGIAQFTHDPGQRGNAIKYVREDENVGNDLFNQYYKPNYGGPVMETKGYVPDGIPVEVNDKFLLSELNYLYEHIKGLKLETVTIRNGWYKRDYNVTADPSQSLYQHLQGVESAGEAARAWTYLYEAPGDIKHTAAERATSADAILQLFAGNTAEAQCSLGGLISGGMNLEQAKVFMQAYINDPDADPHMNGAGSGCVGGWKANCVSFSTYFISKYTNLKGFGVRKDGVPGNGFEVVTNVKNRNQDIEVGTVPRPYAVFSRGEGPANVDVGHTGVILGVDTQRGKAIIGEANCGGGIEGNGFMPGIRAYEVDISSVSSGYRYAYTDGHQTSLGGAN